MKIKEPDFQIKDLKKYLKSLDPKEHNIFTRECIEGGIIVEISSRSDYLTRLCDNPKCESCNIIKKL